MRRSVESRAELAQEGIQLVVGDVTRFQELDADYDWAINCVSSSGGSVEDYRKVYLEGTKAILRVLRERPPARYLFTSSTSVYGQTDGSWANEESPTEPTGETSKVLVETEQEVLGAGSWLNGMIVRLGGIYGPGRGYAFKQFLKGEAKMNENNYMNMIHVSDAAKSIVHLLGRESGEKIVNVVDQEPVRQSDFFRYFAERLNRPMPESSGNEVSTKKRGVTNKRVSNALLLRSGYRFIYPTFREGYEPELAQLKP